MRAQKHNLYEIDLDKNIAFCTACGWTEIYVRNSPKRTEPLVLCIKNAQNIALRLKAQRLARQSAKPTGPNHKPKHLLSEVNPRSMTAICAVCGPTDIQKVDRGIYTPGYECRTKKRNYTRTYRRTHYVARSTNPHALSQIDEEKGVAICAKCGPVQIHIWYGKKINRRCINVELESIQAKNQD